MPPPPPIHNLNVVYAAFPVTNINTVSRIKKNKVLALKNVKMLEKCSVGFTVACVSFISNLFSANYSNLITMIWTQCNHQLSSGRHILILRKSKGLPFCFSSNRNLSRAIFTAILNSSFTQISLWALFVLAGPVVAIFDICSYIRFNLHNVLFR